MGELSAAHIAGRERRSLSDENDLKTNLAINLGL
jgi:hypothetical protein